MSEPFLIANQIPGYVTGQNYVLFIDSLHKIVSLLRQRCGRPLASGPKFSWFRAVLWEKFKSYWEVRHWHSQEHEIEEKLKTLNCLSLPSVMSIHHVISEQQVKDRDRKQEVVVWRRWDDGYLVRSMTLEDVAIVQKW